MLLGADSWSAVSKLHTCTTYICCQKKIHMSEGKQFRRCANGRVFLGVYIHLLQCYFQFMFFADRAKVRIKAEDNDDDDDDNDDNNDRIDDEIYTK